MATNVHWLEVLGRCRLWLEGILAKVSGTPNVAPESRCAAALVQYSLCYTCDSLDAITAELLARRPLQAGVLVRTVFELAMRIRWASLQDDGWRRLLAYWVAQHDKSLKKADQGYLDSEATGRVDETREAYETLQREVPCPQPVSFKDVLDYVAEKSDGCKNAKWSGVLYNGYRDLCRYAHANITVCGGGIPISDIGKVLLNGAAYATVHLVEAARASFGIALTEDQLDELYALPGLVGTCAWEPEV